MATFGQCKFILDLEYDFYNKVKEKLNLLSASVARI